MTKTVKTTTAAVTLAFLAVAGISASEVENENGIVTSFTNDSFTYKNKDGNTVTLQVSPNTKFELTTSEDGTYKTYFDEMRDNDTVRLSINSGNVEKVVIDRS